MIVDGYYWATNVEKGTQPDIVLIRDGLAKSCHGYTYLVDDMGESGYTFVPVIKPAAISAITEENLTLEAEVEKRAMWCKTKRGPFCHV